MFFAQFTGAEVVGGAPRAQLVGHEFLASLNTVSTASHEASNTGIPTRQGSPALGTSA